MTNLGLLALLSRTREARYGSGAMRVLFRDNTFAADSQVLKKFSRYSFSSS